MSGTNVTNVAVSCTNNTTTLSSSATNNSLTLSVTGHTEYGVTGVPASGAPRIITITNSGSYDATSFQVVYSGLPSGATHTGGTCDSLTTLTQGSNCTIKINPGTDATSNNSSTYVSCKNGTSPYPGTVTVSATNASSISTSVIVLDYGCIYQDGYVFAFDDTQGCPGGTCTGSVGGKVVTTQTR